MIHRTNTSFWRYYKALPINVSKIAAKQFALLKSNPNHRSLKFKKIGIRSGKAVWSARVTLNYRALAFREGDEFVWF